MWGIGLRVRASALTWPKQKAGNRVSFWLRLVLAAQLRAPQGPKFMVGVRVSCHVFSLSTTNL